MARTEELSDFQLGTVTGWQLSNMSVRQISALLELTRSTVSAAIVKWKHLGATTAHPRSARPQTFTERYCRVLKHVACKSCLSSVATLTNEFQTASESNINKITICREHEMGFHGGAAAHKPNITMRNAKRRLGWCKAHRHWTPEQWKSILWSDESRFTIWQSDRLGSPTVEYIVCLLVKVWIYSALQMYSSPLVFFLFCCITTCNLNGFLFNAMNIHKIVQIGEVK
jgi:hypothetical protein